MGKAETEIIAFSAGENKRKAPHLLEADEVQSMTGFDLDNDGKLVCRKQKNQVGSKLGAVNGFHKTASYVYAGGGTSLYYRLAADKYYTSLMTMANRRKKFLDFNDFVFLIDGQYQKAIDDTNGYEWAIANPTTAPIVGKSAGSLTGTYTCYYTYLITFPNGQYYETGPSPSASIDVSSQQIDWSAIGLCPYAGSGLTIHRKLYRYSTGLTDTYLVTTIEDNTTTTYSDDNDDDTLRGNGAMSVTYYTSIPTAVTDIAKHLQRIFFIKNEYLYWTEAYDPFAYTSTNNIQVTTPGNTEDLVTLIEFGDQLYIASKKTWYRLQGRLATTWEIKNTFSNVGVVNKWTVKKTRYGIIGQWHDGIYIFDGSISRNITDKKLGSKYFEKVSSLTSFAEYDGRKYHFYYQYDGTWKHMVIDFATYPDFRITHDDFIPTVHYYHADSDRNFYGKSNYEYTDGGPETIQTSIVTGEKLFKSAGNKKNLVRIFYDMDTGGKDVELQIYKDGNLIDKIWTINSSGRDQDWIKEIPIQNDGMRYSLKISCDDSAQLVIYEPWLMEATIIDNG